ncbi:MAG TPA: glutathione S-transferase family protein [Anaeromyxobacteraceae bacterium]|nr:glutathione S-transferase family protein [Anaeromyxobacteraceae bacterium]
MSKPTLIYFATRGRAELIRLVLAEAGVDYQEFVVGRGTPPVGGRPTDLAALKATGELPFDAVPVWEEPGGLRLAQSAAIANHIARAHGLRGRDALEEARCDELLGAVDDVRLEMRKLATVPPEQRAVQRAELATATLPRWLGYLDRLLRRNAGGRSYVVGPGLTVADLALWYLLEMVADNAFGEALARYPVLVAYAERIGSRPRIAAYRSSPRRPPFVPLPT